MESNELLTGPDVLDLNELLANGFLHAAVFFLSRMYMGTGFGETGADVACPNCFPASRSSSRAVAIRLMTSI